MSEFLSVLCTDTVYGHAGEKNSQDEACSVEALGHIFYVLIICGQSIVDFLVK